MLKTMVMKQTWEIRVVAGRWHSVESYCISLFLVRTLTLSHDVKSKTTKLLRSCFSFYGWHPEVTSTACARFQDDISYCVSIGLESQRDMTDHWTRVYLRMVGELVSKTKQSCRGGPSATSHSVSLNLQKRELKRI